MMPIVKRADAAGSVESLYQPPLDVTKPSQEGVTWLREMLPEELERSGEGETTIERIRLHSCRPDKEPKGVGWLKPFSERA
jgi:hypothetical protein